jgi:hypothetical protein
MEDKVHIYSLVDPRVGEPKYVGATTDPKARVSAIKSAPHNQELESWINELEREGLEPVLNVESVARKENSAREESILIHELSEEYDLLNQRKESRYTQPGDAENAQKRPKIRDQVAEALDDIAEENGYSSYDEAISHALREAGYNV